jgi:hypothetical protein
VTHANYLFLYLDPWFPDDINLGKAEYLFFLLGGIMLLNFVVYIPVAMRYKYKKETDDGEQTNIKPSLADDNVVVHYKSSDVGPEVQLGRGEHY